MARLFTYGIFLARILNGFAALEFNGMQITGFLKITKLNIVNRAYCIGRPLIRKCQCSDPVKDT